MRLALVGYGKMGKELEKAAVTRGHQVVAIIDPDVPGMAEEMSAATVKNAEVALEFTQKEAVLNNLEQALKLNLKLVIGTTGWYDDLEKAKELVQQYQGGVIYAPNFSVGVNLFFEVVQRAAEVFRNFSQYDVYLLEKHHRNKVDSPSGTAKKIADIILHQINRKKKIVTESLNRRINEDEMHLLCIRAGAIYGEHSVFFDSEGDEIELTHRVRSRVGLATGALVAAEWIRDKKGFYAFSDVFKSLISGGQNGK